MLSLRAEEEEGLEGWESAVQTP